MTTPQEAFSELIGTNVIMEYVNRQNSCHDSEYMSSATGRLEEVTEEGVRVDTDHVPFVGPYAAICSIRQVGNNETLYINIAAHDAYKKNVPLTANQMNDVRKECRRVR